MERKWQWQTRRIVPESVGCGTKSMLGSMPERGVGGQNLSGYNTGHKRVEVGSGVKWQGEAVTKPSVVKYTNSEGRRLGTWNSRELVDGLPDSSQVRTMGGSVQLGRNCVNEAGTVTSSNQGGTTIGISVYGHVRVLDSAPAVKPSALAQ
ncbi:Hypothetical predicted protein [Mytilus galloprovincialis]|uniref:Uncharacterized protein n=1 Tax=Mytilus galloprovincialis TaxID=29158 RepID=A0A8B6DAI7_MYTGA|nr:Hypothetical predicted protein [Mytilus galloprovincialis]